MRKMTDSERQYKSGHTRRMVRQGLYALRSKFTDVLRALKWITAGAQAQGAELLQCYTGPAITTSRLILWFR